MTVSTDAAKLKADLTLHDSFSVRVLTAVAKLDGVRNAAQTQLDADLRGEKKMDVQALRKLCELWGEIKEMQTAFLPYKLDLGTAERTHSQLILFRKSAMEGFLQMLGVDNSSQEQEGSALG
jgi:hypothetical protein